MFYFKIDFKTTMGFCLGKNTCNLQNVPKFASICFFYILLNKK